MNLVYPLQEVNAREAKNQNGVGIGIGLSADVMYTLQSGQQHGVAHAVANPLGAKRDGGRRGDLDNDTYTLAIRGRGDTHELEYRQDGTANAILQPGGGRGGIGVGAVAHAFVPDVSPAIKARDHKGPSSDGDGDGASLVPVAFGWNNSQSQTMEVTTTTPPLKVKAEPAVAFHEDQRTGAVYENDHTHALSAGGGGKPGQGYQAVRQAMAVRRLTPTECERLQGFPDGWTAITFNGKPAADGPRYRALGNSMAVVVMRWIGRRIAAVALALVEREDVPA